ncbi:kinetochore-associated Ndc80 complex subunit ndc80, partial [Basidiobolus ranarum]
QQHVQKIQIEYDQLILDCNMRKEDAGREIFKILEELITFKTHVETSLSDLEVLVKEEFQTAKGLHSTIGKFSKAELVVDTSASSSPVIFSS